MRKPDQDRKRYCLALLGSRGAIAQTVGTARSSTRIPWPPRTAALSSTQDTRLIGVAPVGHRQPHARGVAPQSPSELWERLTA